LRTIIVTDIERDVLILNHCKQLECEVFLDVWIIDEVVITALYRSTEPEIFLHAEVIIIHSNASVMQNCFEYIRNIIKNIRHKFLISCTTYQVQLIIKNIIVDQ